MMWFVLLLLIGVNQTIARRQIDVINQNGFPIWIETKTNGNQAPLMGIVRLNPGERMKYPIQDGGWAGRLWAKVGCDDNGVNCEFGQSVDPCPPGGCQPPAETKVEFFYPPINSQDSSFYDISLVDGFSLASDITPYRDGQPVNEGSCVRTNCHLPLGDCPKDERSGLGDLTVRGRSNNNVACLSPCKRWNYPPPYGFGRNEQEGDGRLFCCPGGVSVEECRNGIVVQTDFVKLVRRACPSAYSYSYDDEGGLHNCQSDIDYVVTFSS